MAVRIVGALFLALAIFACGDGSTPIGGGWYAGRRSSWTMDDRGAKGTLHRIVGGKQIDVGTDVYNYHVYPPDCVVWQTGRAVFAACGDRRPFPVTLSLSLDWEYLDDRINYLGVFEVAGGRESPQQSQYILIDSVRVVAARQPRLDESYHPTREIEGDIDPSLDPTVGDAPAQSSASDAGSMR